MPSRTPSWTTLVPIGAVVVLGIAWGRTLSPLVVAGVTVFLAGAVFSAVHHAEVVAHRVGEPFGSLVLAVAVTVIEVALIVTLMIAGAAAAETLARDTVFAAGHHHIQRHRGPVDPGWHSARIGRVIQRRGNGCGARHGRDAIDALPGRSDVHDNDARSGVLAGAARVRGDHCPRALRTVRRASDRQAP